MSSSNKDSILLVLENIAVGDSRLKFVRSELTTYFAAHKVPVRIGSFNVSLAIAKLRLFNQSLSFEETLCVLQNNPFRNQLLKLRHFSEPTDIELFKKDDEKRREQVASLISGFMDSAKHLFVIDFEASADYPVEVAVAKLDIRSLELQLPMFHSIVTYHSLPPEDLQHANDNMIFCHGIHFSNCPFGTRDYAKLWTDMLHFFGIENEEDSTQCIILAKEPRQENACIEKLKSMVGEKRHILDNWVIDIQDYFQLKYKKFASVAGLKKEYLVKSNKCAYHQTIKPKYHCALEDVHMIVQLVRHVTKENEQQHQQQQQQQQHDPVLENVQQHAQVQGNVQQHQ